MATDRCPLCGVPVKSENLIRHLDSIHPRHPDTQALREKLRQTPGHAPTRPAVAPFRLRRMHVVVLAVVLVLGVGVVAVAPYFSPYANLSPDTCVNETGVILHIHVRLNIYIQGGRYPIPNNLGNQPGCTKVLHTHADYDPPSEPAIIHVESPVVRSFSLGDFFHVWDQPFSSTQILSYTADATNSITMTVNGVPSTAYGNLELVDGQVIVISYGP